MNLIAMLTLWGSILAAIFTPHIDSAVCVGVIAFAWLMTRKGERI